MASDGVRCQVVAGWLAGWMDGYLAQYKGDLIEGVLAHNRMSVSSESYREQHSFRLVTFRASSLFSYMKHTK